jgi:hypothetical protein
LNLNDNHFHLLWFERKLQSLDWYEFVPCTSNLIIFRHRRPQKGSGGKKGNEELEIMNKFGRYTWPEMTNPIPQNVQYLMLTAKLVSLCVLCQILKALQPLPLPPPESEGSIINMKQAKNPHLMLQH